MANFNAVINMGGYAGYVWSSYLLVGMIFIGNAFLTKRKFKKTRRQLQRCLQGECL